MKIIEVKNFSFRYANGNRNSLENVTLDVEEGTFNVLCGKSGCGKSTLLRQLKSDLAPCGSRSGRICYYGQDLEKIAHRQQSQEIGYVLQNPENQIVTDKVWHELAFGLESLHRLSASGWQRWQVISASISGFIKMCPNFPEGRNSY